GGVVAVTLIPEGAQFAQHLVVDRVEPFGSIQREDADRAIFFKGERVHSVESLRLPAKDARGRAAPGGGAVVTVSRARCDGVHPRRSENDVLWDGPLAPNRCTLRG